ncbi:unnamed protein product [Hymenolepis diminuta]|uniref:Uncharacterized protein n=1 Tax=Hymenolepis diminuta TaxID=6216 RepID=A0A0R3SXS2_HYMDI|nr:unnamed protein product [Hymenolepis diminuta]
MNPPAGKASELAETPATQTSSGRNANEDNKTEIKSPADKDATDVSMQDRIIIGDSSDIKPPEVTESTVVKIPDPAAMEKAIAADNSNIKSRDCGEINSVSCRRDICFGIVGRYII